MDRKIGMPEKGDKRELIRLVAQRTGRDPIIVAEMIEHTLAEIAATLGIGKSVSLRDFGTFYVRPERAQWVFKLIRRSASAKSWVGRPRIAVMDKIKVLSAWYLLDN